MFVYLILHLDQQETLVNTAHIVQIKHSVDRCEIITLNGVVRPDESYDQAVWALKNASKLC